MGLDYNFYFAYRCAQGWYVPPDFRNHGGEQSQIGYFAWMHRRDVTAHLFFGESRLFEMLPGPPPDWERYPFFRFRQPQDYEGYLWSLSGPELMLDAWDKTIIVVQTDLAAQYAHLFGDGQQPFPDKSLQDVGVDERTIDRLGNTSYYAFQTKIAEAPIDRTTGRYRNQLSQVEPDYLVSVTWTETLSGFIGEWRNRAFQSLRQYGNEEDLHVTCILS
jgi:hypothetical protein